MDLRFTREEQAFRTEVRDFLRDALPEQIRQKMLARRHLEKEHWVTWQRILNAKGWAVPGWPVEYGGTGWTPVQRYIFLEELHQAPAPEPLSFNVGMLGPVLIAFGSEEQKKRFLPRIANLDDWWCQGFSEPGAGSDLASLSTAARREGDQYVVTGQKLWTTQAHFADWMFCLVRTDSSARKQNGISMLLIDMKTPGISVRPVITIDGQHETNEVFLDDVRVPVENRVGEENRGWTYTKHLLGNERSGIARIGVSKERVRRIKTLAQRVMVDGQPLSSDAEFRRKLAAVEVELKALEMTQLRAIAARDQGAGGADPFPSILKIKGTELQQATTELLMDMLGPMTLPDLENVGSQGIVPDWALAAAPSYLFARAYSIFGGSNEIQKNIIAKTVLGLS
jgi:pimeloyl-CoA dehydrogenase large subunit